MQSLDRILTGPAANGEFAPLTGKNHDRSAPDDFGRLMQQALAPKQKESPKEIAVRAERKHSAQLKIAERSACPAAVSVAEKISSKDADADRGDTVKKTAAKTSSDQNSSTADNNLWLAEILSDPTPQLALPMPMTGCFVSPQTTTEFLAGPPARSGLTVASVTDEVGGVATATTPAMLGTNSKMEAAAADKTKSLAKELAEIKDGVKPDAAQTPPNKIEVPVEASVDAKNPTVDVAKLALNAEMVQKATEQGAAEVAAVEKGGTGVATVDSLMKKSANTIKVAGLGGTVLPSEATLTAPEKVLPVPTLARPVRAADNASGDLNPNLTLPNTFSAVDFSSTQSALILPSLTDARMRNLERAHDMVMLHAVRMVEAQTDAMHVVIKPDGGTELSLQLRQRDGFIEAEATLQHGDYQLMNQHWTELQERLEQRGIKLAPLSGENQFSSDGGNFKQQQRDAAREIEAQKASAFAEFAVANHAVGATARLAVGISGWESWA